MTYPIAECYGRGPGYRGVQVSSGTFAIDAAGVVSEALCIHGYISKRSIKVLSNGQGYTKIPWIRGLWSCKGVKKQRVDLLL